MPKPSIIQTILRQPSQSYSDRSSSNSYRSSSRQKGDNYSLYSDTSSILSAPSIYHDATPMAAGGGGTGPPLSGPGPGGWEWSVFGARKGLTGGPASLRAPSEIERAVRGKAQSESDAKSLRSVKSWSSMRSRKTDAEEYGAQQWSRPEESLGGSSAGGGSLKKKVKKGKGGTSRSYLDLASAASSSRAPTPSSSRAPTPSSITPTHQFVPFDRRTTSTSRRYQTPLPPPAPVSGYYAPPAPSTTTTLPPKKKKKKTRPALDTSAPVPAPSSVQSDDGNEAPPSLTSSVSASSSPPLTPVNLPSHPFAIPVPSGKKEDERIVEEEEEDEEEEPEEVVVVQRRQPSERTLAPRPLSTLMEDSEHSEAEQDGAEEDEVDSEEEREVVKQMVLQVEPEPKSEKVVEVESVPTPVKVVERAETPKLEKKEPEIVLEEGQPEDEAEEVPATPLANSTSSTIAPEPEKASPRLTTVPLPETSAIPSPSAEDKSPIVAVGKVYTMDEFFASLPLAPAAAVEVTPPVPSPSLSSTKETIKDDYIPLSSIVQEDAKLKSPSPETTPSEASSVFTDRTDVSTAPTIEMPKAYSKEEKGKGREGTKAETGVPRIQLTRTESDQKAAGVQGDVEIDPDEITSKPPPLKPKSAKRASVVPKPEPILEIVASSSDKPKRNSRRGSPTPSSTPSISNGVGGGGGKLTSENLAASNSANSTAAQDAPRWLKSVRALDEAPQFQPLVILPGTKHKRVKSTSSHRSDDSIYSALAQSNVGSLRGPPSIMESMPDHDYSSYPSPPTSVIARSERTGSKKRRSRTKSATPALPSPLAYSPPPRTSSQPPPSPQPYPPSVMRTGPEQYGMAYAYAASDVGPRHQARSVTSQASVAQSEAGYSAMSMPVEAYRPTKTPKRVSMGATTLLASSATMNALSISANATASRSNGFSLFKRNTPSQGPHPFDPSRDLTFGGLQPPPKKLRSDDVLVEVLAVGLDQWDYERAAEMTNKPEGFGWVPGRSFCGRVVEVGYEVSRLKKGDFVYGLNELRRSGALAELLTVNRDLLTLAPAFPLSVEQIAALPLGVNAIGVMQALCEDLPKGSKVLILNGHEGVGNLCMQLSFHFRKSNDLWLVATCPRLLPDGPQYCRATGASDVIADEPLAALNSLHESSFDVVIDTIGGRRLYDASRRILHFEGHFVTTVGDSLSLPDASTQWKSGIRSLRRSFFKKDKKSISYWAVNLDQRENTRECLEKLREAVDFSKVRPTVSRIVPLPDSARAFESQMGAGTVVRVMEV